MQRETIQKLIELNNTFYQQHHASFSASRQNAWPGWTRLIELLSNDMQFDLNNFSVLDFACGNLRFHEFLNTALPEAEIDYYALDNSLDLIPENSTVNFQNLDVLAALLSQTPALPAPALPTPMQAQAPTQASVSTTPTQATPTQPNKLSQLISAPACDLTVCFGFMHHVPTYDYRTQILETLLGKTKSGSYLAVSFWQFMQNENLAAAAIATHQKAIAELGFSDLDYNDYIIGWNNIKSAYRYCHSFTDFEIDELTASIEAQAKLVARFSADGSGNALNSYVILRKS